MNGHPPKISEPVAIAMTQRLLQTSATTQSVADELGVSRATVEYYYRRHSTPQQRQLSKQIKISAFRLGRSDLTDAARAARAYDFSRVDWDLPNAAIARQLGSNNTTIHNARRRLNKSTVGRHYHRPERVVRAIGLRDVTAARRIASIVDRLLHTSATLQTIAVEMKLSAGTVHKLYRMNTTAEQRQAARRRKISAKKKASPSGNAIWKIAGAIRRQSGRPAVECRACGADLASNVKRCPKCGAGVAA